MTSTASGPGIFVAGRMPRWVAVLGTVFFGSFAVFAPQEKFSNSLKHIPALAVDAYLVFVAMALIWGCVRALRMGVRIDGNGVTVRNYFRTYWIGWPEVNCLTDGAAMGASLAGANGGMQEWWALSVLAHNGRAVTATGTIGPFRPEKMTAIKQSAEHYGITANLTGIPTWRGFKWRRIFTSLIVLATFYAIAVWTGAHVS
jgi:hypothetical protein